MMAKRPCRRQTSGQVFEQTFQLGQLAVDDDAQGLERAGGRILVVLAPGHRPRHQRRQRRRGGQRLLLAVLDDEPGDAPRVALLAEVTQHALQLALVDARQVVSRGLAAAI